MPPVQETEQPLPAPLLLVDDGRKLVEHALLNCFVLGTALATMHPPAKADS